MSIVSTLTLISTINDIININSGRWAKWCPTTRAEAKGTNRLGGGKFLEGAAADPNVAARFSAPIRQRSIPDRAADRLGVAAEEGSLGGAGGRF